MCIGEKTYFYYNSPPQVTKVSITCLLFIICFNPIHINDREWLCFYKKTIRIIIMVLY